MRFGFWISVLLTSTAMAAADHADFVPPQTKLGTSIVLPADVAAGDENVTISVLVIYSARLERQLAQEQRDPVPYIVETYRAVNRILANTGLATRIDVVDVLKWDLAAGQSIAADTNSLIQAVEVDTQIRDEKSADLVQLWESLETGYDDPQICGWGQSIGPDRIISSRGFGYSTVGRGSPGSEFELCYSAADADVFSLLVAHELGHNLGAGHDWASSTLEGAYPFAHGAICGAAINGYPQGTVMSNGGFRLPFFSTPSVFVDGERCGEFATAPYPQDNRDVIRRSASTIAGLREGSDPGLLGEVLHTLGGLLVTDDAPAETAASATSANAAGDPGHSGSGSLGLWGLLVLVATQLWRRYQPGV